jgi:hypothetical protein
VNIVKSVGIFIVAVALLAGLPGTVMADEVHAGSSTGASVASVVTHLSAGFIGSGPGNPVTLNYAISAKGITLADGTYVPMSGDVSAFFSVHSMGGRDMSGVMSKALEYREFSSASGLISSFSKSVSYTGGFGPI